MIARFPVIAAVTPFFALALPMVNSTVQVVMFVIVLLIAALILLLWLTTRAMLKDVRDLLRLVKSYLALTGDQQREAARLVSEVPHLTKATVKDAINEVAEEVAASKSGELSRHALHP